MMSVYRGEERYKEEYIVSEERECRQERSVSPRSHMEQEKRIRREIANSNERRRMQSINAGFNSLRNLIPSHEGEKLSKAAILQQTAEYIYQLEQEKTHLLTQNCQLKRLVNQHEGESNTVNVTKKRKIETASIVCESLDEGIGLSPEPATVPTSVVEGENASEILRREVMDLRIQLDRERRLKLLMEEKLRLLESYPPRVQVQYTSEQQTIVEETVEEMEVPLPLVTETDTATGEVLTSVVLPPVLQTTTPEGIKLEVCKNEDEKPPDATQSVMRRLPSAIEAAIKAEPKVEVERLPTPPGPEEVAAASTAHQNLETIMEAIRHLEGDVFNDIPSSSTGHQQPSQVVVEEQPVQDVPLALTTRPHTLVTVDMNHIIQYHTSQNLHPNTVSTLQQQRPGVIVVQQHT